MRSAIVFAALVGLSCGSPAPSPQSIDFSIYDAASPVAKTGPPVGASEDKVSYDDAAAASAAAAEATQDPVSSSRRTKRTVKVRGVNDPCSQQPDGYGPTSSPDTYDSFMNDRQYSDIAEAAPVPQGYQLTFSSYQGATEGNGYMGLYTLQSYDTVKCQQLCDAAPHCYGFNLYQERDPKFNPADTCPDPQSITNFKCTLWGLPPTPQTATNQGQWRNQFHVGISGSNGYQKLPPPNAEEGFDGPIAMGGAIQAPSGYMGAKYFPGVYDPGQCAAACTATTQYDHDHPRSDGTYDACNFFNSYVLSENNVPQGTYCAMYTQSWDRKYSTNVGQWRGSDYYSVSQSYGYVLSQQDPGTVQR